MRFKTKHASVDGAQADKCEAAIFRSVEDWVAVEYGLSGMEVAGHHPLRHRDEARLGAGCSGAAGLNAWPSELLAVFAGLFEIFLDNEMTIHYK